MRAFFLGYLIRGTTRYGCSCVQLALRFSETSYRANHDDFEAKIPSKGEWRPRAMLAFPMNLRRRAFAGRKSRGLVALAPWIREGMSPTGARTRVEQLWENRTKWGNRTTLATLS